MLDDSSSALDYKTDSRLRASLRKQYSETTKIIVAQRVSSISHADLILVLNGGKIVGSGKHEELIENCPIYKEISRSQIGGTIE